MERRGHLEGKGDSCFISATVTVAMHMAETEASPERRLLFTQGKSEKNFCLLFQSALVRYQYLHLKRAARVGGAIKVDTFMRLWSDEPVGGKIV